MHSLIYILNYYNIFDHIDKYGWIYIKRNYIYAAFFNKVWFLNNYITNNPYLRKGLSYWLLYCLTYDNE